MINLVKTVGLSPLLVAILATTAIIKLEKPAKAETNEELVSLERKISVISGALPKKPAKMAPAMAQNEDLLEGNPTFDVTPATPEPNNGTPQQQTPEPQVIVGEVLVTGVEGELRDLIYNTISVQPGRTATRSQLEQDLKAIYATGLFAQASITPEDTPLGIRLVIAVEPNPILNEVQITHVPETAKSVLPPDLVNQIFSPSYGKILNLRTLQDDIKKLNEWYRTNGYELAQVVGAPKISPDGTVTLIVAEGVIENIKVRFFDKENKPVEGNTRDFIITREVQLKPGDVFNRTTAQKDLQRIFGLGIFEDARFSFSPGDDPSQVVINVDIVEGNTGSLAAGAGFSSASGLFGTVSYQQQNVGGNNQILASEIQLSTRELLFNASFTDPWIGGDPYRTSYTVDVFRSRSISLVFDGDDNAIKTENGGDSPRIVRTGGGITFSRPIAPTPYDKADWRLSLGLQYQHVSVQNADGDISPRSRESDGSKKLSYNSGVDDLVTLRFVASSDKRDNVLQPTSGSFFRVGVEQTLPITGIIFNRIKANYSYYIPLKLINFDFSEGPQAISFNVQAGTILGGFPPYEAFVLGGTNSVRGYGEGDVGSGRSFLQASIEYRFPVYSVIGGALFFDYGTALSSDGAVIGEPSRIRHLPGWGYGYGLGVRIQSPLGPIRLDYGINNNGEGRIHFGIGERF